MMRIRVIVVGKPRQDVYTSLVSDYLRRLRPVWPTDVVVVAEERLTRNRDEAEALRREAKRIQQKCPQAWPVVVLDRAGETMDSSAFADRLRQWEEAAVRGLVFVIGGPNGLDPVLVKDASLRLSFGPMTFPHDLALVMLCEQLYRALSILKGWPYHRS